MTFGKVLRVAMGGSKSSHISPIVRRLPPFSSAVNSILTCLIRLVVYYYEPAVRLGLGPTLLLPDVVALLLPHAAPLLRGRAALGGQPAPSYTQPPFSKLGHKFFKPPGYEVFDFEEKKLLNIHSDKKKS